MSSTAAIPTERPRAPVIASPLPGSPKSPSKGVSPAIDKLDPQAPLGAKKAPEPSITGPEAGMQKSATAAKSPQISRNPDITGAHLDGEARSLQRSATSLTKKLQPAKFMAMTAFAIPSMVGSIMLAHGNLLGFIPLAVGAVLGAVALGFGHMAMRRQNQPALEKFVQQFDAVRQNIFASDIGTQEKFDALKDFETGPDLATARTMYAFAKGKNKFIIEGKTDGFKGAVYATATELKLCVTGAWGKFKRLKEFTLPVSDAFKNILQDEQAEEDPKMSVSQTTPAEENIAA